MVRTPRLSGLLAASTLVLGACAFDSSEAIDTEVARLAASQPELAEMPEVTRLVATDRDSVALIAGRLGSELEPVAAIFDIEAGALELIDSNTDALGNTHQRFSQSHAGLPVVGGDLRVSRDASGQVIAASGSAWGDLPATDPSIDAVAAADVARAATRGADSASAGELVYVAPSDGSAPVLAWRSVVTGFADGVPVVDEVFVDATTGAVVDRHPQIHTAKNRETYTANNTEDNIQLVRTEGQGPTGDTDIDLAHDAAGSTYDCLSALFARDSFDGNGSTLISIAHFGQNIQNAFWDGTQMIYGDGFAVIDVGTHEFGHGVTQNTANLVYQNEPGALNEAMSDILSAICDARVGGITETTWILGEDLDIGAIRQMDNPRNDGISRDHYRNLFTGPEDNGGVHINSGIANLAFVLLTQGGTHPRNESQQQVVGIGIESAGQIFYKAMRDYMNQTTNFAAARAATEMAAADLFGAGSAEAVSVSEAWFAVGVGDPPGDRPVEPEEPEEDPGDPNNPGGDDNGGGGVGGGTAGAAGCSTSGGTSSGLLALCLVGLIGLVRRRRS